MGILQHDEVLKLYRAAVSAGLGESRGALLSGIDAQFVAELPVSGSPRDQILHDLDVMNRVGLLANGNRPLELWLSNAAELVASRVEASVFEGVLAQLRLDPSTRAVEGARAHRVEVRLFNLRAAAEWCLVVLPETTLLELIGELKRVIQTTPWRAVDVPRPGAGYQFRCYLSETEQTPLSIHLTVREILARVGSRALSLNIEWYVVFRGGTTQASR